MGNCCGKESVGGGEGGNFKGQGRTLGDAPPRQAVAPASGGPPAKVSIPSLTTSSTGRTLGAGNPDSDAKSAAAIAAEV
jgi:hypothetical protein